MIFRRCPCSGVIVSSAATIHSALNIVGEKAIVRSFGACERLIVEGADAEPSATKLS